MNQWSLPWWVGLIGCSFLLPVHAAPRTWGGAGNGDWFTSVNWSELAVPADGDSVTVSSGSILLTNSTASLASFTINGATVIFTNWGTTLNAATVSIQPNGVLTLPVAFTNNTMSNNITIVCTTLTIDAGGSINANSNGFAGGKTNYLHGNGPGAGLHSPLYPRGGGGAGHGGGGGIAYDNWTPRPEWSGQPYGSISNPVMPGSGGAACGNGIGVGNMGGNGGGAVRIQAAGVVTVNGGIFANGGSGWRDPGSAYSAGCGSGGSVWIDCNYLAGTGTIRADGGIPIDGANFGYQSGGGGGGGRIAVIYDVAAQDAQPVPNVFLSAAPGIHATYNYFFPQWGDAGTVYMPSPRLLMGPTLCMKGNVVVPDFTNWSLASLTVTGSWVRIMSPGLTIQIANNLTVNGKDRYRYRLETTNAALTVWGTLTINSSSLYSYCGAGNAATASIGAVTLTNAGAWSVYSGTNPPGRDYGSLVTVLGDIVLATNSWISPISHPVNGSSPLFRCQNLSIATVNSGFSGSGSGYGPVYGAAGLGPGGGANFGNYGGGGGYGGAGGQSKDVRAGGGPTYGSLERPVDPGSAGGSYPYPSYLGGHGGGLVRVEAVDRMILNGSILANGLGGGNNGVGGGGSGGGIYLRCKRLNGTNAVLSANGGSHTRSDYGGAGGGGRIAVHRVLDQDVTTGTWSIAANGGTVGGVNGASNGFPGTIFFGWIPAPGTVILIR